MLFVNELPVNNGKSVQIYVQGLEAFFRKCFWENYLNPEKALKVTRHITVRDISGEHLLVGMFLFGIFSYTDIEI